MANAINLPLLRETEAISTAWERMTKMDVSAIVVNKGPTSFLLFESDEVWQAWEQHQQLTGVTGGHPLRIINETEAQDLNQGEKYAMLAPSASDAVIALVLTALPASLTKKLAPQVRVCEGPQKHTLPPATFTADRKCGVCGSDVT
jgi:hypothetical protein